MSERKERIERIMVRELGKTPDIRFRAPYQHELDGAYEYAAGIVDFVDSKFPPVIIDDDAPVSGW